MDEQVFNAFETSFHADETLANEPHNVNGILFDENVVARGSMELLFFP